MAKLPEPTAAVPRQKRFLLLAGVGLAVILIGSALPYLILGEPTDSRTQPVFADQKPEPPSRVGQPAMPTASAAEPSLGTLLLKLAVGIIVVSGLVVAVARMTAKRARRQAGSSDGNGMSVIAGLPLNNRCRVLLVGAGKRRLLVGVDFAGVKSLVQLPDQDDTAEELDSASQVQGPFAIAATGRREKAV